MAPEFVVAAAVAPAGVWLRRRGALEVHFGVAARHQYLETPD